MNLNTIKISQNTRNGWTIKSCKNYSVSIEKFNNSDELIFQAYDYLNSPFKEIVNTVYKVKTKDLIMKIYDNNEIYGLINVDDVKSKGIRISC